jgi:L-fucose mutarotase
MLKTIPPLLTPELLWCLAAMGHGDRLGVVNANYPAYSRHERVIALPGVSLVEAIASILQLMPVDDIGTRPAVRMVADGQAGDMPQVHRDVQCVLDRAEGRSVEIQALERTPFFDQAGSCFAAVHTSDNSPFGCFVFTKGVVRTT